MAMRNAGLAQPFYCRTASDMVRFPVAMFTLRTL
jgi:hypothetical protein